MAGQKKIQRLFTDLQSTGRNKTLVDPGIDGIILTVSFEHRGCSPTTEPTEAPTE